MATIGDVARASGEMAMGQLAGNGVTDRGSVAAPPEGTGRED